MKKLFPHEISDAIALLPEPYKSSAETRVALLSDSETLVAAEPNNPPLKYDQDKKVWERIEPQSHREGRI